MTSALAAPRSTRFDILWLAVIVLATAPLRAHAATCTWNSSVAANWHLASNWTGCGSGNGTPAGTPGPADRAVLPAGTGAAQLNSQFTSIAELEMASGSTIGIPDTIIDLRQLTVTAAASFSGATLTGTLPPPLGLPPATLAVVLPEGSTAAFAGGNTLRRAIVNSAGTSTFAGGPGAALNFDVNGGLVITPTGTGTINGNFALRYTTSGSFTSQGTLILQGPGLVGIERSGANGGQFTLGGLLEIRTGTLALLNPPTGFQHNFNNLSVQMIDATINGGTALFSISNGRYLRGNGTINGPVRISGGTLDPQAADGSPVGVVTINGSTQLFGADLVLDVAGPAAAQHDRLVIGGSVEYSRVAPRIRLLDGYAPGIDTSFPIATHTSVVSPTLPVHDRVYSDYPLSFALRVAPTTTNLRVVPTLSIADTAVLEGNSGTQTMNLAATLSAPTSQTVSFRYTTRSGTASDFGGGGLVPDYNNAFGTVSFAPGEVSRQIAVTVRGDTSVEAEEAFSVVTDDDSSSQLQNASFGNYRRFSTAAEGLIRDDDGPPGTRYLLVAKSVNIPTATGQRSFVRRYTTAGASVDGWATQVPATFGAAAAGLCRAPDGDVLSTRFAASEGPVRMSPSGALLDGDFGGLIGDDESCAFDLLGNVWVGEAGPPSATTFALYYLAGDGRLLETLQLPVGERGVDWIELDTDQCTLYYTSEDSDVRRYDVCARTPIAHFATGLEAPCFALRQLPNRELMVTCRNRIYRYSAAGGLIREYTRESLGETNIEGLFALHLDPDGETFWAGGLGSGRVVRARIDDGTVVTSFSTGPGGVSGLLVQDEYLAGISVVLFRNGFE